MIPTVLFTLPAFQKMQAYVHSVNGEVSGLGVVEVENNTFIVSDILLMPQVCTASKTTMSEDGIAELMFSRYEMDLSMNTVKLWWHSHFHSPVFWSKTDNDTIQNSFPKASWILSVVTNRRGHMLARVDLYKPIRLTIDNLPISISLPVDKALLNTVEDEVKQKVIMQKRFYNSKEKTYESG